MYRILISEHSLFFLICQVIRESCKLICDSHSKKYIANVISLDTGKDHIKTGNINYCCLYDIKFLFYSLIINPLKINSRSLDR